MMLFKKNKPTESVRSGKERRNFKRINKSYVLKYCLKSNPEEKFEITQLKNISWGGMCFVTTAQYDPDTQMSIELKTPYVSETTFLEGKVLQSHEKAGTMLYQTRLEFLNLNDHANVLLKKIIETSAKELG